MPKKPELPGVDALFSRPSSQEVESEEHTAGATPKPVKFTFYFSPDTLEALETAWFELRRRTGRKISKSEIVDRIVRESVQDIDRLEQLLA